MDKHTELEQIVRYLSGECSGREEKKIETWMDENPDKKILIQKFQYIWESNMNRSHFFDAEAAWDRMKKEMDRGEDVSVIRQMPQTGLSRAGKTYTRRRPSAIRQFIRAAAAIILIGFAALYYYQATTDDSRPIALQEVVTERGERADVRLNDGSRIRLGVDSKVSYPGEFGTNDRTVNLSGEAYFEVAPDDRPFLVYADEAVVQILGTEFNVQSYADEEIQVVVAEGKVAVRHIDASDEEAAHLERGDMARLVRNGSGVVSVTHNADLQRHLGWLDYRLEFDSTPLAEVFIKLQRWYNIDISLSDPSLSDLRFTAVFEDESVMEVLQAIEVTLDLEYKIQGRNVTLYPG